MLQNYRHKKRLYHVKKHNPQFWGKIKAVIVPQQYGNRLYE